MAFDEFLEALGPEIDSLEEEYFSIFAEDIPSQGLGGIDTRATSIDLNINGRDLTIHQSPSILTSQRAGGTTGAVVWKITPLFAEWITSSSNPFLKYGIVSSSANVLELGCGISGIIGLCLGPHVSNYVLSDQTYVLKLLNQNLEDNVPSARSTSKVRSNGSKAKKGANATDNTPSSNIVFQELDWETDSASSLPHTYDLVIACDCIYNDALVPPFVSTLADICALRREAIAAAAEHEPLRPTIVVIGQQRRSSEVFEDWLIAFHKHFRTWRVPDELLSEGLKTGSGYLIHVGVLR